MATFCGLDQNRRKISSPLTYRLFTSYVIFEVNAALKVSNSLRASLFSK
jgi:hypothetical protein